MNHKQIHNRKFSLKIDSEVYFNQLPLKSYAIIFIIHNNYYLRAQQKRNLNVMAF